MIGLGSDEKSNISGGDQSPINPKLCLKNLPLISLKTHSVETTRNLADSIENHMKSFLKESIFPGPGTN